MDTTNCFKLFMLLIVTITFLLISGCRGCDENEFQCRHTGTCVNKKLRCNFVNDCEDYSDEESCPGSCNSPLYFNCTSSTSPSCVLKQWRCDRENDCKDKSDELNCSTDACPKELFTCVTSRKCIHYSWYCDGTIDCSDGSDEMYCAVYNTAHEFCSVDQFMCNDGQCINQKWVCDGQDDCADKSDEKQNCSFVQRKKCESYEFQCSDGRCIPASFLCDGENDCSGGEDEVEAKCASKVKCKQNEYHCPGTLKCISLWSLCNGVNDCIDSSDEGPKCSESQCDQNCDVHCQQQPSGVGRCICNEGFEFNNSCIDINECERYPYICDQVCNNTIGSYKCGCYSGYVLQEDYRCHYNGSNEPEIVYIDVKIVKRFSLTTGQHWNLITNLSRGVALDYDSKSGKLFYTDVTENLIYSSHIVKFSKYATETEKIVDTGLAVPDGIAVDWIGKIIYFAESSASRIDVCEYNGKNRAPLISTDLASPRGLALDPRKGFLFITDWGGVAKVLRAQMDGSNIKILVTDIVGWPNGITIDYGTDTVYWIDARYDYIESINYDGSNRHTIIKDKRFVPHPFAVTFFGDYLYFTDWVKKGIVRVNKFNSSDYAVVLGNLSRPMDLQVISEERQPSSENPCDNLYSKFGKKCSHLCVIRSSNESSCLCGARHQLSKNGFDCEKVNKFLIFARSWEVRGISLDSEYVHDVMTPILGLSSAVGTDFHASEEFIYFSDVRLNKIGRVYIGNDQGSPVEWIIESGLQNPDGIAVDWIGGNLYWTDTRALGKSTIGISKLNGSFPKIILTSPLGKPRAIVVHPARGYLFYTDWLSPAKIGRADMNGKNFKILVKDGLAWPNGLSIDYQTDKVYWGDAKIDRIECMDLNGDHRTTVIPKTHHSFGLAVDDDYIYWTDWLEKKIQRANKTNFTDISSLRGGYGGLMEIQIYNKNLQKGSMMCANSKCEQLCIPLPQNNYVCACGTNYTLTEAKKCVSSNSTKLKGCSLGEFQCQDGACINEDWKCDGHTDCKDFSDEDRLICRNKTCKPGQVPCKNKKYHQCISPLWRCDGQKDCDDGSDEDNCMYNSTSCKIAHNIPCKSGGCVDPTWKCDGYVDCKDGSDEEDCGIHHCSDVTSFQCQSDLAYGKQYGSRLGSCIPLTWVCDGTPDCNDKSDESNKACHLHKCQNIFEVKLCDNRQCISSSQWCDGVNDCSDWSDEKFCNNRTAINSTDLQQCHAEEFTCKIEQQCISNYSVCDFTVDCNDATDEQNCSYAKCQKINQFTCDNQKCVLSQHQCDGTDDCGDNSDEKQCDAGVKKNTSCTDHQWNCKGTNQCIEYTKVCDSKNDCPFADDEGPLCKVNYCEDRNGGCLQTCYNTPIGAKCACEEGYISVNDTCLDINECLEKNGYCSHHCFNTRGSYKCTCEPGYTMRPDRKTCSARGPAPTIIFSDHKEVRQVYLDKGFQNGEMLVGNLKSAIGVDFHWEEKRVYWSDVSEDKIERMFLNGTGREEIVNRGMNSPEGLAVDWIAGNIYWTDMRLDTIEAAKTDGSMRSIILSDKIDAPRALSVDPRHGFMFWSDWGKRPLIERADMDGGNRTVLVTKNIVWPNGITLDLPAKMIYFVDARLDILDAIDYEGNNRRTVVRGGKNGMVKHPFACSIFEDTIYFTDWTPGSIRKINKYTGGSKFIFKSRLKKPMDIQVLHPSRQPGHFEITNHCVNSNCSHLCVLKPNGYSCKCPFGLQLKSGNNHSCETIKEVLLYARRQEIRGISLDPNDTLDKILPITGTQNAIGIDFHFEQELIYWTDVSKESISRMKLNGTQREDIYPSGLPAPDGIAIDWIANNMYWTDADTDKIEVARLDGRYRKVLISTDLLHPRAIVLHPIKGKMLWTDWGKKTIEIATLAGENRTELVSKDIVYPNGITISFENDRVYWCDASRDIIESVFLNGTDRKVVIPSTRNSIKHPFAMATYDKFIYWTDWGKRAIMRYNLETKEVIIMRENYLSLMGLRIYHKDRQPGTNACKSNPCSHLCFALNETDYQCSCATGYKLNTTDNTTCIGANTFLLYSTTTEVHAIPVNGNSDEESIVPVLGLRSSYAIDFEYKSATIYAVDDHKETIYSVKQDGSQLNPIITSGLEQPQGIAVDWLAGNLYWTDAGTDIIEVSRLDGSHRLVIVDTDLETPRAIVLYPVKGLMFWSDWGKKNPKIERAALDGSKRVTIVNGTKMARLNSKITWPNGLTIDYDTNLIYWVDASSDILVAMGLNGENMKILLKSLSHPYAVTVDRTFIYWTDWTGQGIFKYPKAGGKVTKLRGGIGNIRDVHYYNASRQQGSNPCADNGGCHHLCLATSETEKRCVCTTGRLAEDKVSCTDVNDFLIFAKRNEIQFLDLNPRRRSAPYKSISSLQNVIGIDFHFDNSTIYYSDISKKEIGKIDFNGTHIATLITGLKTPDGVAFDWMSGRLYWTDAQENTINRLALNNTKEVLVHEEVDEPRAIALSPCDDLMYWTDWGDKPYIRSATMDGYNPKAIIDKDLGWPNGLCVDMVESRIYWADARTDRIESATLMGLDRRIVVPDVPHVFGVTLYGDYLYWTDWFLRAVMRADKTTGKNRVVLKDKLDAQPMDIKIFSKERQNCSRTPCYNKGGCSDICTVKADTHVCSCEKGYELHDGYRCVKLPIVPSCKNLQSTPVNKFLCTDGRMCIEGTFLCDGDIDCTDGSDEDKIVCAKHVCPAQKFACKGTKKCIPNKWVCDSEPDCPDGSDEFDCKNFTCKENDFVCNNGQCISKKFQCDDEYDCLDRSDENGCLSRTCRPGFFKCTNGPGCIRNGWLCDGFDDCTDGSDEDFVNCKNETCSADQFSCASNKGCFPLSWKCDSTADCADGSDELTCNTTIHCQENQVKCADGKVCVDKRFLCDGEDDCFDGSDELNCNRTCPHNMFQCVNTSRCISLQYQCDGDNDCGDSSDEDVGIGCDRSVCRDDQFRCDNLLCIHKEWRCDHEDDCGDMSDEKFCACAADEKKCRNGECLPASKFCDNNLDCKDGSDELSCSDACPLKCGNGTCIPDKKICDRVPDCVDESDEKGCNINECANQQFSQCSQICEDLKQGFRCSCKQGFALQSDQKTCLPNCSNVLVHGCSHFCILSNSTKHLDYKCRCADGYSLDSNKRSCKHNTNEQPFLLTANKHSLQWLSISGKQKSYEILRNDLSYALSVDFHWRNKKVYWIDRAKSEINSASFGHSGTETSNIHKGLGSPLALAVDWIAGNLYFTDDLIHNIFVSKLNGLSRKTLYQDNSMHPLALVCHYQQGYLYYSSKSFNSTYSGSISRVGMDGTNHQVVLNKDIILPMDMTIDLVTETLYWSDLALKHIKYMKLISFSGTTNSIQVSVLVRRAGEVLGLTTFEDFLYFSTKMPYGLNKVHRWRGGNITLVKRGKDMITSIKVVHPLRQPGDVRSCRNLNCEGLCLLSPTGKPHCACPDGFHLSFNGKNCVSNCTAGQFQCKNYNCISASWRCDRDWDCTDGSDEIDCPKWRCKQGLYKCLNDQCIKAFHVCDGGRDCLDGSDENTEMCQAHKCFRFQFRCDNNLCIRNSQVCDSKDDCGDGSDERNCTRGQCPITRFLCTSGECIPKTWICDNTDDCADGSDENSCRQQTCQDKGHFRCNNSRCILRDYVCDGDDDCRDKSDESRCHNKSCNPNTQRTCNNGHCISKHWYCDGENDCEDGSDELNCPGTKCSGNHFRCDNQNCVLLKWQCDGENDCGDNSDEKNCPTNECQNGGLFQCKSTKTCISEAWKCDRHPDCLDFSDEKDCGHFLAKECHHGNEFQCDNEWQCIPTNWVCDNDTDCFDGSDEHHEICSTQNFCNSKLKFRCEQSGFCIEKFRKCDGKADCEDGSDEKNCTSKCKASEFKCSSSGTCIDQLKQCDYYQDCPNNEDEEDCGKINSTVTCTDQCGNKPDVACVQTGAWIKCSCMNNTVLDDNKDCADIDECRQTPHVCEQQCINVRHSYICRCVDGYELKNGGKCKAKGSPPQLFVPAAGKLIRLSTYEPKKHNKLYADDIWSEVTSLDFFMRNDRSHQHILIMSDAKKNLSITGISLAESLLSPDLSTGHRVRRKSEPRYTIRFKLFNVAAVVLKIDYVGGNIFWIDNRPNFKGIFMSDIGGNYTVPVLRREVKLDGLALDLENGYMYWTENSYHSHIYKAQLNGEGAAAKFVRDRLVHPVSLHVDPASKRLFWADLKKHSIECIHLDGTHRLVIADNMDSINLAYPFSIDVFEGHIFGVTQRGGKLFKLDKFGPNQPVLIKSDLPKTSQVRIFHENRQLPTDSSFHNPCLRAYCPKLCVVINQKAICVCQKSFDCQAQACDDKFCHNRGTCARTRYNENICRCNAGYNGTRCELQCNGTHCLNGGTCQFNKYNQMICSCVAGWSGDRCVLPTCRNFNCKEDNEECRIEKGKAACRLKKNPSSGSSGSTKTIMIVAPVVIVITLLIVVMAVLLVKRARQSYQFAPKKIKDIQMQNPLYSYVNFDNDNDNDNEPVGELDKLTSVDEREEANLVVNEY